MKTQELLKNVKGIHTIESVKRTLNVDLVKAIYYIHRLRKMGYVKTRYTPEKKRVYYISFDNKLGGKSYIDVINEYAPLKLVQSDVYKIYGREITVEEAIIYAIKQKRVRFIIACLSLFKKIKNWSALYKLAKNEDCVREVAALYDVARLYIPKIPRMPERFRNLAKPKKTDKYKYIIKRFDSKHFKELEKKWKVYIPLNKGDLEEYRI